MAYVYAYVYLLHKTNWLEYTAPTVVLQVLGYKMNSMNSNSTQKEQDTSDTPEKQKVGE